MRNTEGHPATADQKSSERRSKRRSEEEDYPERRRDLLRTPTLSKQHVHREGHHHGSQGSLQDSGKNEDLEGGSESAEPRCAGKAQQAQEVDAVCSELL